MSVFGVNLDLSKIVDKSFEKLEKVREEQKEEKTKTLLNSGAIICFDDFERKSKDIDLNDLFGFITNLTIEFDCKVVIILYHYIVRLKLHKNSYLEANYVSFDSIYIKEEDSLPKGLIGYMNNENYNKEFIDKLKVKVNNDFNEINKIDKVALLEYINNNQSFVNSLHFINSLKIDELFEAFKQIKLESLQKINNFIETGILINE